MPAPVYDAIVELAQQHGVSASQMIADLMAVQVGMPDLVWPRPDEGQPSLIEELQATG